MAKRLGTVLTFREGVTQDEAEEALDRLEHLLEPRHWLQGEWRSRETTRWGAWRLEEYDDEMGTPIWYIP